MFKKLIIAAISASFVASAAFADSTSVGFRISGGNISATGTETTNTSTTVTQAEKDADFVMGSVFLERSLDVNDGFSVTIGLDYVPFSAEVAKLDGGDGFDATLKAGDVVTAYLQPTFSLNENVSLYAKAGFVSGNLEITDISRQATTGSTTIASTDTAQDKKLEGVIFGLGAQLNVDAGPFNFIRLEAVQTDFDTITHTNSNSKVLTASADMTLVSLSIGKSF